LPRSCIKKPQGTQFRASAAAVNDHQQLYELLQDSSTTRPKYPEKEEIKAMIAAGTFVFLDTLIHS
jgi:hypothetical protein